MQGCRGVAGWAGSQVPGPDWLSALGWFLTLSEPEVFICAAILTGSSSGLSLYLFLILEFSTVGMSEALQIIIDLTSRENRLTVIFLSLIQLLLPLLS